jgi:hypothetical protein
MVIPEFIWASYRNIELQISFSYQLALPAAGSSARTAQVCLDNTKCKLKFSKELSFVRLECKIIKRCLGPKKNIKKDI